MPVPAELRELAAARRQLRAVEERLRHAVEAARGHGATWADIGEVLGTSRQAAFQRFGRPVDPRTGTEMEPARPGAAEHAVGLLTALAAGRWEEVRRDFDDTMTELLDADKIAAVWAQLAGALGAYERMDAPFARRFGDLSVVDVTLHFEAGEAVGRVSYDRADRVAGLRLIPAEPV